MASDSYHTPEKLTYFFPPGILKVSDPQEGRFSVVTNAQVAKLHEPDHQQTVLVEFKDSVSDAAGCKVEVRITNTDGITKTTTITFNRVST